MSYLQAKFKVTQMSCPLDKITEGAEGYVSGYYDALCDVIKMLEAEHEQHVYEIKNQCTCAIEGAPCPSCSRKMTK